MPSAVSRARGWLLSLAAIVLLTAHDRSWTWRGYVASSFASSEHLLYHAIGHAPCVMLLNRTGAAGCSTPAGRSRVVATLQRATSMRDVAELKEARMLLTPPSVFSDVVRARAAGTLSARVKGVLVERADDALNATADGVAAFSNAERYPQSALALGGDAAIAIDWNPVGDGAATARFDRFPIAFLDADATTRALEFATENAAAAYSRPSVVASANFAMAADGWRSRAKRSDASRDSIECVRDGRCLPVGAHSVVASAPPVGGGGSYSGLGDGSSSSSGFVLVACKLDGGSGGMFQEMSRDANGARSGLIATLAAAKAYSAALAAAAGSIGAGVAPKPVVFAAFGGESFGYSGSRRFARELHRARASSSSSSSSSSDGAASVLGGLAGMSADAVVEMGAVGLASRRVPASTTTPTVYAHANVDGGDATDAIVDALIAGAAAAPSGEGRVEVKRASGGSDASSAGSLPPSSAFSFIRRDASTPVVVLAEHDGAPYSDPFYGGVYDAGVDAVDAARMARVAAAVARAVARLAFADAASGAAVSAAVSDAATASTTSNLTACLVDERVGLAACDAARALFTPNDPGPGDAGGQRAPGSYPGVAVAEAGRELDQDPRRGKGDVAQFAWQFLGEVTAVAAPSGVSSSKRACGGNGDCDAASGETCVGAVAPAATRRRRRRLLGNFVGGDGDDDGDADARVGACLASSPRFIPATSHRFVFDADAGRWNVADPDEDEEDLPGGADALWAESDWPSSIGIEMYRSEGVVRETMFFALGVAVVAGALACAKCREEREEKSERYRE